MLACLWDLAHTHTLPIYQLKGSVYEKYIYVEQKLL
jgi:hypothetical protein